MCWLTRGNKQQVREPRLPLVGLAPPMGEMVCQALTVPLLDSPCPECGESTVPLGFFPPSQRGTGCLDPSVRHQGSSGWRMLATIRTEGGSSAGSDRSDSTSSLILILDTWKVGWTSWLQEGSTTTPPGSPFDPPEIVPPAFCTPLGAGCPLTARLTDPGGNMVQELGVSLPVTQSRGMERSSW